jgi:hypothetical protein
VTPTSRGGLFNSTLIVTTIVVCLSMTFDLFMRTCVFRLMQEAPYVMFKNYSNSEFEGFCIDLLEELARVLKFRYKIKPIMTSRHDDMVEEIKSKVGEQQQHAIERQ